MRDDPGFARIIAPGAVRNRACMPTHQTDNHTNTGSFRVPA